MEQDNKDKYDKYDSYEEEDYPSHEIISYYMELPPRPFIRRSWYKFKGSLFFPYR